MQITTFLKPSLQDYNISGLFSLIYATDSNIKNISLDVVGDISISSENVLVNTQEITDIISTYSDAILQSELEKVSTTIVPTGYEIKFTSACEGGVLLFNLDNSTFLEKVFSSDSDYYLSGALVTGCNEFLGAVKLNGKIRVKNTKIIIKSFVDDCIFIGNRVSFITNESSLIPNSVELVISAEAVDGYTVAGNVSIILQIMVKS